MKRGAVAVVGFMISTVLFTTAAVVRWWPCGWPVTQSAGDAEACMLRQDDLYDRTMLGSGSAHEWLSTVQVVAYVAFALALVLVVSLVRGRHVRASRVLVAGTVLATLLVVPIVDYLVAVLINGFYMSHDATPWTGIPSALGALLAAVLLLRELPMTQRNRYSEDTTVNASTTLVNNA